MCVLLLVALFRPAASAQDVGLRTNLLYWATTTPNLGIDVRLSDKYSLSLDAGYNAFNFKNYTAADGTPANPKFHHWLVMPEVKRWFSGTFRGHYLGLHVFGGMYNAGGLKFPAFLKHGRYEGSIVGAGVSYGYQWRFGRHWALAASVGAGYAYLDYKKYKCGACGSLKSRRQTHYFGPTQAAVTVIFYFGAKPEKIIETRTETVMRDVMVRDTIYVSSPSSLETGRQTDRAETTLYLNFPLDRSEIYPDFANNAVELRKAEALLRGARVSRVAICGYASPEGKYGHNKDLSAARAESVGRWVEEKFGISPVVITASGFGEDWQGLRDAVAEDPSVPSREQVIDIIDNIGIFEGRELKIMQLDGGRPYRYMLIYIFPRLRRMEMKVEYDDTTNENGEEQ